MTYYKKHTYLEITSNDNGTLDIDSNNFRFVGMTKEDLGPAIIPFLGMSDKIIIKVRTGPEGVYLNPAHPSYKNIIKQDQEILDFVSSRLRIQSYGYIFTKPDYRAFSNVYSNYRFMRKHRTQFGDIEHLKSRFKGRDILFCGAGPSIKEYLGDIRKIIKDNSAIVVAGGSALRLFYNEGIIPHFGYVCDCWESEYINVFSHLDSSWVSKVNWVVGIGLDRQSFELIAEHGNSLYINGGLDVIGLIGHIDQLPKFSNGLAVSNGILDLCNQCIPNSLTLLGVDLCFGSDGSLYADNHKIDSINEQVCEYKGFKTRQAWINEVDLLNIRAKDSKYRIIRVGTNIMEVSSINQKSKIPRLSKGLVEVPQEFLDNVLFFGNMSGIIKKLIPEIEAYNFDDPERVKGRAYQLLFKPFEDVQFGNTLRGSKYDYLLMNSVKTFHLTNLQSLI